MFDRFSNLFLVYRDARIIEDEKMKNEIVKIVYRCNYCGCEIEVLNNPYVNYHDVVEKHEHECIDKILGEPISKQTKED